ncbi:Fet3 protein [Fomitiporia mediterranea MF3/22]|uniref:Fet3 protein n=1 Tax=Fomitiporia mediterranea (strain MF3/22) TaxID=694068 RepID=UPI000440873B|nr:Fet3 protein [Fomitiporia mediterranea MF3/22]EJC98544.1 Fet3 protein [Fomitiporia mediterranea MF3/22]
MFSLAGTVLALSLAALSSLPVAQAGITELWWNITYVEDVNPDGLFPRRAIGVNNSWPPPPIDVSANDTLILHALNSLTEPTTLHHHGMFFNNASWYDGAVGVSQCGIPPGDSFTYVVPINESGQWGTYWVHAHDNGHYVDGLRAPVVIHPQQEVHTYDEEFTIVVGDWYHDEHGVLLNEFISIANPGGAEPVPKAPLIYFAQNGTYMNGFNGNASLPFQPGKTYRLRIVNTSAFAMFFFWVEGHQMRIIEVDGTDTQEMPVDLLSLTVAQRYSVLVTALNDSTANWAIHANMDTDMFDTVPDDLNPNATAQVIYSQSFTLNEPQTIDAYGDTNDTALVPVQVVPQYSGSVRTVPLVVSFDTMTDGTNRAMFNNITYNTPVVPSVFSAVSMDSVAGPGAADVASAYGPWNYVLDDGDVVDILLMNSDAGKHPFHLHGHQFQIVNRATDYTSDDPSLNPPLVEGQPNPVRRDTVQVESGASVTLRFQATNPGAWMFHCHIEWHLQAGLAVTFITAPEEMAAASTAGRHPIPQFMFDQCAALNEPTTGNAAGKNSTTDLTGLTLGPFLQNNGWHGKGIGAMFGCVLTAFLGMLMVSWYALGERLSDEEVEAETRRHQDEKEARGRFFGVGKLLDRSKAKSG